MSPKPDEDEPSIDLGELADALGQDGQLIPETTGEVELAESSLDEDSVELPPGLEQYTPEERRNAHPRREQEENHPRAKMGVVIPFFSAGAGFAVAAAALLAVLWPDPIVQSPPIGGTPDEIKPKDPLPKNIKLDVDNTCEDCCGGNACSSAQPNLRECSSGRLCVPCQSNDDQNAYKIRLSALHTSSGEKGPKFYLEENVNELQLCALAQGKALGCRPASESPDDLLNWASLPTASTRDQLVGGIELRLVHPKRGTVAEWRNSVLMSPETLCRGAVAMLRSPKKAPVGVVSLFFDDAYFVELFRAASVKELQERGQRIEGSTSQLSAYQTTQSGDEAFALVVGPLAREPAEKVRWQLLDQGLQAKITFGEDYQGLPRPKD